MSLSESPRPRVLLAILALFLFVVTTRGHFSDEDTLRRFQVTHWLWSGAPQVAADRLDSIPRHPTLKDIRISPGFCDLTGKNGEIYAQYSLGQSLLLLPGDLLAASFLPKVNEWGREFSSYQTVATFFTFSLVAIAGLLLSFELLLELEFSVPVALSGALLGLLGTSQLVYLQDNAENSQFFCAFVGAMAFILKARRGHLRRNLLIAGALSGFAVLTKLPTLAYVLPLAIMVKQMADERSGRPAAGLFSLQRQSFSALAWFGAPIAFFGLIDRGYEFYRFGDVFGTYMNQCVAAFAKNGAFPANFPFGFDPLTGIFAPFTQLERAIWLFDPFLLVAALLFAFNWRRFAQWRRRVVLSSVIALAGLCLIFGGSWYWNGGAGSWGPRHHLVPADVICMIGFAFAAEIFARLNLGARIGVGVSTFWSVVAQVIALPFPVVLEYIQIEAGDPMRIVQFARLRNLYLVATGGLAEHDGVLHDPFIPWMERWIADPLSSYHTLLARLGSVLTPADDWSVMVAFAVLTVFSSWLLIRTVLQGFAAPAAPEAACPAPFACKPELSISSAE